MAFGREQFFSREGLMMFNPSSNMFIVNNFLWCLSLRTGTMIGSFIMAAWSGYKFWENYEVKKTGFDPFLEDLKNKFFEPEMAYDSADLMWDSIDVYCVIYFGNLISAPIQLLAGFLDSKLLLPIPILWNAGFILTHVSVGFMLLKSYFDILNVLLVIVTIYTFGYFEVIMIHQMRVLVWKSWKRYKGIEEGKWWH